MAKIGELARLFRAISTQNWAGAEEIASKIITEEEKKGHHGSAQALRGSLSPNGVTGTGGSKTFLAQASRASILSNGLTLLNCDVGLADVILRNRWQSELQMIIKEWKHREYLAERGLQRRSKLFFYGPPGCGKSMTGRALGRELSLPVYVVRFDAIIGAYLGQTAIHLHELFRYASENPCILLLDEVDALGKQRGNPLDVGELDRIVISLMQELEHCHLKGFVIATSNLAANLDKALWRRFDLIVEFPKPTRKELDSYIRNLAGTLNIPIASALLGDFATVESYAEAKQLIENEARRLVLLDV